MQHKRGFLGGCLIAGCLALSTAGTSASPLSGLWLLKVPPFEANDTGGIIAWSPGIEAHAPAIVSDHCGRYGKYGVITSIHPWPGDFIGFICRRPGRYGPMYN